jgi:hypothetical protein
MPEGVMSRSAEAAFSPSFHLWMTLLMAFFVFAGFGMTYLGPMAVGTMAPAPPVVHVHGALYFGWTVLLVLQSLLVNANNVRLHRSLGTFGIAFAGALVVVGLLITLLAGSAPTMTFDDYGLMYLSYVAPPSFAVLFAMAIRAVRTPAQHRNLILLTMLSILMPGINRLYMMSLGLSDVPFLATYLTMDAMIAALFVHDWWTTAKVGRPTVTGAAILIVPQVLFMAIVPSKGFAAFCAYMGSLIYYR